MAVPTTGAPKASPPVRGPGGGQYRRTTRRWLSYLDTVILTLAIVGVGVIVWQLSQGTTNLNDGLVSLVTASLTAAIANARTSREYYFGSSAAPEEEDV